MKATGKRDFWLLTPILATISVSALIFYFRQHALLLYGDAVAHTNIARHVFDSRTPGVLELGTVWLPLPHLLDIPFVANHRLWQSGVGASVPSMIAFVAGALGIFRLVGGFASPAAAWMAALIYGLNPNLIYLQTTAMTEALYLALFIWAVVYFCEFVLLSEADPLRARKTLEHCAIVISGAMLVRYDGWFLAVCAATALAAAFLRLRARKTLTRALNRGAVNFILLTALTGILWLAYNYGAYGRAMEFATGPYSARAIAERTKTPAFASYPGENSLRTAAIFFLKASSLNVGEGPTEKCLLGIAFAALLAAIYFSRKHLPLALLWAPAIFYCLSVTWGSVPIYFPNWWPHSFYNTRYGVQMLPAIAVFTALGYEFLSQLAFRRVIGVLTILITVLSYGAVWRSRPITLREAEANGEERMTFDRRLAEKLKKLPASATLMMYCGSHSGALQDAGIPFRRVLREGNHPDWRIGLSEPAKAANYMVAISGDDVFLAVRLFPQHLRVVDVVETAATKAWIYQAAP